MVSVSSAGTPPIIPLVMLSSGFKGSRVSGTTRPGWGDRSAQITAQGTHPPKLLSAENYRATTIGRHRR